MQDWTINPKKDPCDFGIAALKSIMAGLETINFSELIPTGKVAEVCASLDARGIERITIEANKETSGKMMHDFIVCGFIPTGELIAIEVEGETVYAFEFERETQTGGCRKSNAGIYKVMGR